MAYIRTIHTSFTAAHPNPWSRPAAVAPLVNMHQPLYPAPQKYATPPAAAPPASGAGGRRRAYAFRAPTAQPVCKFDPFGDEPTSPVPNLAALASLSAPPTPRLAAASLPPPMPHHHLQQYAVQPQYHYQPKPSNYAPPPRRQNRGGYYAGPAFNNQQRPRHAVEAPTEIWRSNSPAARAARYELQEYNGDGGSGVSSQQQQQVRRTSPPPPAPIPVQARRTPSPPAPAPVRAPAPSPAQQQQQNRFLHDKDAKAKLVAGILLNRVHAVGRPRRRVPSPVGGKKPYVPSALSQVVACAA